MAGDDLTKDDLRNLARELDKSGEVSLPESKGDQETDRSESATDQSEEIESPDQDEIEKESKKAKSKDEPKDDGDEDSAESSEISDDDDKRVSKDEKDKDRLEKNWKKLEERKKAVDAKESAIAKKERELAKKATSFEEERDNDGYTVKDYQVAAKKFRDDGDDDLATKAEGAARTLYNQAFQRAWTANLEELVAEHPELTDSNKPLTQAANKVLEVLPFLRSVPDGCRYAVRIAQGDNSSSMISELKAENKKLKQELGKLEKATRISGGGTYRVPVGEHDIASLPRSEGRKRLRALAEAADKGDIED